MSDEEHDHDHGEHGHGFSEMPHEPAPPEKRRLVAEPPLLARGVALGALAVGAGWLGIAALQKSALLAPLAAALGIVGALAGWAAAIHVTGGEKFDDHPFV